MVRATSFGKQTYGLWFEATQFFYSIMSMHKISPEAGGGGGGVQVVSTHDLYWPHQSPDRLP